MNQEPEDRATKMRNTTIGGGVDTLRCRVDAAFHIDPVTLRAVYLPVPPTPCPRCGTIMPLVQGDAPFSPPPHRACEQGPCVTAVREAVAERIASVSQHAPRRLDMTHYRSTVREPG